MFCHVPFTNFHIFESGDVYCCCPDWLPVRLGNVLESDPMKIWNGPVAEEVRRSILDGSFKFCTGCVYLPRVKGPVTEHPWPPALEKRIRILNPEYDRTCNLRCPSCRSDLISRPSARAARIHEIVLRSKIIEQVEELYLSGTGEPLASPCCLQVLRNLPVLNPRARVSLHTNCLLLDDTRWSALGPARNQIRQISVSVDAGTPETYRLNRGGSWEKLWRNVDFINDLRRENRRIGLIMYYVVQDNNFRELIDFCRLAFEHGADSINVFYLRHWKNTFSDDEYRARAVHLPGHPNHAELCSTMKNKELTTNPSIVLPTS
jgi:MoaA/NifB/PqqE/SkfB family radical SAM enzyme